MASFIHRYFPRSAVAANDIGWISYANHIRLLDLTGLTSWDVFKASRVGTYTTDMIDSLAKQQKISIAIV